MIVMEAKHNICSILDMICDIRLDFRLTGLLNIFKQHVEGDGGTRLSSDFGIDNVADIIDELMPALQLEEEGHFVPIVQDLVLYEHTALASSASSLLIRHYSQLPELVKGLSQVQILISQKNVKTYQVVQEKLESLRSWKSLSSAEATHILQDLSALCYSGAKHTPKPEHQRILHNLGAHEILIEIPHMKPVLVTSKGKLMMEFIAVCFNFLREFCRNNPENQMALFPYVSISILIAISLSLSLSLSGSLANSPSTDETQALGCVHVLPDA